MTLFYICRSFVYFSLKKSKAKFFLCENAETKNPACAGFSISTEREGRKNLLKGGDFSNENPFILGVSGGRNTVGTRAAARRYPTDRTTTNKRVLGRKTECVV